MTPSGETATCDVCGRGLDHRTKGIICAICRSAGAVFRRRWEGDLLAGGRTHTQVCAIVDSTERNPRLIREAAAR